MTALDDQVDAAIKQVRGVAAEASAILGRPNQEGDPVAGPVKDLMDLWRDRVNQGKVRQCAHLMTGGPRPVHGLLPLVGEITCMREECVYRHRERYFSMIPRDRCDACGKRPPGNRFHELVIHGGIAIIGGNVCPSCFALACPDTPEWPADYDDREAAVETVMRAQGMCSHCNAISERSPHPLVKGLTVVNIQHDSWCPVLVGAK